jgi:hypothetical protein
LIGLKWIYSVFTMRTLYTLFALISLVLVALVATAAPANPTLTVNCTLDSNSVCTGGVSFSGDGLNPHKAYAITATLATDPTQDFVDGVTVNSDGTYSAQGEAFVSPGSWTFTLSILDHSGNPQKDLVVETVLFE